jgi:glycosyltransferase involved in cell wall biosynthesis
MKVAVVTPTIASKTLQTCIDSVKNQTYSDIIHYVFIDGSQYKTVANLALEDAPKVSRVILEDNVGQGWYGHRVYAACSFLVNADAICYLDEDNWFEPNHIEKLVSKLQEGNPWAYSLRKIVDKDGNFVCEDNCESLGKWPVYFNKDQYHIDTSSFIVRREIALRVGHTWYGQWGADRQFFNALKSSYPNFGCTHEHSLNYRLDGNPKSVTAEFFENGNAENAKQYPNGYPWKAMQGKREEIIGPGITIVGA